MIDDFARRCAAAELSPVVDAGCGTGRISAHLVARGLEVTGIDLSSGMIDVARRNYPSLHFETGALESLPLPDSTAGGLLAWYSLIHAAPQQLAPIIAEFARVLRPGAWLLIAFQAGDGRGVDITSAYGHTVAMTNYRHDPAVVTRLLEDHGIRVHARMSRASEGTEKTAQAIVLAQR
ncbi:class I SAM-dependent DNA methyltransferase [Nocardioides seonyuensis]|nr:class I SAM-dependent methyltransferase [Nocardioides seonyuensis]